MEIHHKIINESDSVQRYGPWEVTVVPAEGARVFFSLGEEPENTKSNLWYDDQDEIGWFSDDHAKSEAWHKTFNNATEGWLAYIYSDRTLFIKSFTLIHSKNIDPGHGNVEVYVSKKFKYIELENHGKYSQLEPGKSYL